jgi:hypothetical protein
MYVFMYIFRYCCTIVHNSVCFDKLFLKFSTTNFTKICTAILELLYADRETWGTFYCECFQNVGREKRVMLNYENSIRRTEYVMLETFMFFRTRTKNKLCFIFRNHDPGNTLTNYRKTRAPFAHIPVKNITAVNTSDVFQIVHIRNAWVSECNWRHTIKFQKGRGSGKKYTVINFLPFRWNIENLTVTTTTPFLIKFACHLMSCERNVT